MRLPVIGLMLGDMTGIGPEVSAKVLTSGVMKEKARILVVGDARVLAMGARDAGVDLPMRTYSSPSEVDWDRPEVPVLDLGNIDPATITRAQVSPESGRITGETLKYMTELALAGGLDAVTFAPLNKAALNKGGWKYPDEHQMFGAWVNYTEYFQEMNVQNDFWTSRVTSHIPFRTIMQELTTERIIKAIALAHNTMTAAGHDRPRIAVAALNPHGGEGGLFGDEETTLIKPAIDASHAAGINCSGPYPADTVFVRAYSGEFDSVVSMYHDQGQIATKLKGFNQGVTVTAGLPVLYTTPAHGTAFDIVGKGKANTGSLEAALSLAARLASARLARKGGAA